MKSGLLGILSCPKCGARLTVAGGISAEEELETGELVCSNGHRHPVVNGIPRFVRSELYVTNFGFEWTTHSRTQLDTSTSDESERTFRAKTGFTPEELNGKLVLDVGCGMGRFADVASRWGATVVGIDLSLAVEAAQHNVGRRENVHIVQADICELPFRDKTFDFIFSIGVLHHTPNTKAAFDNLPGLLRENGEIAVWLYPNYDRSQWRFSDLYRRVTPKLPKPLLHTLCYCAVPLHYLYKLPMLGWRLRRLLPISSHPKSEWRVLDTFDWYSPEFQWKHTYEEVLLWFEEHGLRDIQVLEVPVALKGTRRMPKDAL